MAVERTGIIPSRLESLACRLSVNVSVDVGAFLTGGMAPASCL